jgi:hypothetical protein
MRNSAKLISQDRDRAICQSAATSTDVPNARTSASVRWIARHMARFRAISVASSLLFLSSCTDEAVTAPARVGDAKTSAIANDFAIMRRLPRESGTCLATTQMKDGTLRTRLVHLRLPESVKNRKTSSLGYFMHANVVDQDSFPTRMALCTLPQTAEAADYFSRGFSRAANLSVRGAQQSNTSTAKDYREFINQDILASNPTSVSAVLMTRAVAPSLRQLGAGTVSLSSVCDPNAIIQEPDCVPDGSGGGGGSGGTPQYCDPGAILAETDCALEEETIPETPPTVWPDVVTNPPTYYPCRGWLLTEKLPAVTSMWGAGVFPRIVGNMKIVCDNTQASLAITYILKRQSCFLGWCIHPTINRGTQFKPLTDSTALQVNTVIFKRDGWYRDKATYTVFWLNPTSLPTTEDSDMFGFRPAFRFRAW